MSADNDIADQMLYARYPVLRFFAHEHLPAPYAEISKPFCELARHMAATLPYDTETSVGLRKLLEAKDACVRASFAGEGQS